jgi:hypothetical protein
MRKRGFRIHLNIGTVIFGVIFIYLIITLLMYAFRNHIDTYQVTEGPLSGNDTYNALILRDETVVESSADGYVNFYIGDSSKVSKGDLISSVTSEKQPESNVQISGSDFEELRKLSADAAGNFDPVEFENIYDLQYSISNIMWDAAAVDASSGHFYTSSEDGIVSTFIDGYEDMTADDVTPDFGRNSGYEGDRHKNQDRVQIGDGLYRLISGENWSIIFTLTDDQLVRLASLSEIKVKFLTDNNTEKGELSFFEKDGQRYGRIDFDSGLIRYVDERFIDVEIISNTRTGLKIPVSSIVKKEFYTIPEAFLTYSGESGTDAGFLKEVTNEDGTKSTEFVRTSLYEKTQPGDEDGEALYYVDMSAFEEGDVLVATDSTAKYTIGKTAYLEGVYSVNRGYAVFRKIKVIDQNLEYCIVEEGTDYGISLYDFIVQDGSKVKENQIVK